MTQILSEQMLNTFFNRLDEAWERKAVVWRSPSVGVIANEEEIFDALKRAANVKIHGRSPRLSFYIENAEVFCNTRDYLPRSDEHSLEDYISRIRNTIGNRRFALVADSLEVASFELWERAFCIFEPILQRYGWHRCTVGCFIGDIEFTPFGLHQDFHSTFLSVVSGEKRMHLWPPNFVYQGKSITQWRYRNDYQSILAASELLSGGPGDWFYWPRDLFHVADNPQGRLTVTLNIGISGTLLDARDLGKLTGEQLWPDFEKSFGGLMHGTREGSVAALSAAAKSAYDYVISERVTLEQGLMRDMLSRVTAGGFKPPQLRSRIKLHETDLIRVAALHPIVLGELNKNEFVLGANGQTIVVSKHPEVLRLVNVLNGGNVVSVYELIGSNALQKFDQQVILIDLLEQLLMTGTIERV
ncbi:hypothetical protein CCP3SC5AM1_2670003 [Gammaproteobacteria bacterium]